MSNTIPLEGTDFIMLAGDTMLPTRARSLGTIQIETAVANLPEVKALGPKDTVVDVGAFIGDTALTFAQRGSKVIAFEAHPDAYQCAVHNTKDYPNVQVHNFPVGNRGYITLNSVVSNGNLGSRNIIIGGEQKTLALDDFIHEKITFLKIDVEGYELFVLHGAKNLICQYKPKILMEISTSMLARYKCKQSDVFGFLNNIGYTCRACIGDPASNLFDMICWPL